MASRPPPDLRYGLSPNERARLHGVCEESRLLIERAREAVAHSTALLGGMHPSVRDRLWPPSPPVG